MSTLNPLTLARKSLNLTQQRLADDLGVTVQVITNAEAGLFNSVPSALSGYLHVPQEHYLEWVTAQRHQNEKYFQNARTNLGWKVFKEQVSQSNRGFCRRLVFQPSILREYEQHKRSKPLLAQALSEVGLSPISLRELKFR
jgi:hypothetical protein